MILNREIAGIVLQIQIEELAGVAFCKMLTSHSVETIKLPTLPNKYKYGHLIQPNYLLKAEATKTRKNWILTTIHTATPLVDLENYKDFLKYSEMINYLNSNLKEGEQTSILEQIVDFTKKDKFTKKNNLEIFKFIDVCLGFS